VFSFPKNLDRRELWRKCISRDDLVITDNTAVCEKHFESRFIIRRDEFVMPNGEKLSLDRKKIKLTDDAFPSVFPNLPAYLSIHVPAKRKDPDDRRKAAEQHSQEVANWLATDNVISFVNFRDSFKEHLSEMLTSWKYIECD